MMVTKVLQGGSIFDAAVLDLSEESILAKFQKGVGVLSAFGLGLGVPTVLTARHSILNGFKNLVAAAASTEYEFPQAAAIMAAAAAAPASGSAPADTKEAKAEEAPAQEDAKASAQDDVDMGNLFGGDDDDY